jgi:predicted PurR-regulated permease PerM
MEGGGAREVRHELSRIFAAPNWLRDAGIVCWLLVGIVAITAGAIAVLSLTSTIVMPVIAATIIASVAGPVVAWLERHRLRRVVASILVLLAIAAAAVAIGVIVLGGITSQADDISNQLGKATNKISTGLKDLGVGDKTADNAKSDGTSSVKAGAGALLEGIGHGLSKLASIAVFASFTLLSLFFLLKDGPSLRDWIERHAGVPPPTAHTVVEDMLRALRGYFGGVTLVAAFNAAVIGLGALVIGVPLAGTIAIVTFLGAYIPYLGAWTAGAFAVLLALGAQGSSGAIAMAIIALLANGILQQIVQPFAFGAALNIHPLAVLIVTVAGGGLFGMVGLVLAAPVTSAIMQISRDFRSQTAVTAPAPAASG